MTNTDAAALLGLQDSPTPDQVRRRYEELHNDFQIRLTNAPTAVLKKTYQRNLQELQQAADLLAPGAGVTFLPDLPSPEPVLAAGGPAFAARPTARAARENEPESESAAGLPRSTMIAGTIAALLAGLSAFLGLTIVGRSATQERATQELAAAQGYARTYSALEYADPLRIRNLSRRPLEITALSVTYMDAATGTLKTVHSAAYGYHTWRLEPNALVVVDQDMGRGRDWTGRVVFYSLIVDYPDIEPYLKSGVWAKDIENDKALQLKLD